MSDRILILCMKTEAQEALWDVKRRLGKKAEDTTIDFCGSTNTINKNMVDSETPEDESTWNLPNKIYHTRRLRQHDEVTGMGMTINLTEDYMKRINERYGVPYEMLDV